MAAAAPMPTNRDEFKKIMRSEIIEMIGEEHLVNISKLTEFFPAYDQFKSDFEVTRQELKVITAQLDQSFPEFVKLIAQADEVQKTLAKSIGDLEVRGREASAKLTETFAKIDTQLEAVQLQAATVEGMQQGIHGVVVKQQQDMEKVKVDVQIFVAKAMSGMEATARQQRIPSEQFGQRKRESPKLNDAQE